MPHPVDARAGDWPCDAYGPDAVLLGARCFFSEMYERTCPSQLYCKMMLAAERQRMFQRINELAAAGDETMEFLAETFTSPDQLLGGPS